jgi:acyl phosphate:glycerol-3-phosphate acyltransferase
MVVIAYLMGSVLFSIVLAKIFNANDPRSGGSKNTGATNMLRVNSLYLAILTLLFDMLKGLLPVAIAIYWGFDQFYASLIGLAAIIGHIFPVFYKFSGGKGVASAIGVIFAINYVTAILLLLVWLAVFSWTKLSSLSALIGFFVATIFAFYSVDVGASITQLIITLIIFLTHKQNIIALYSGKEEKSVIFNKK